MLGCMCVPQVGYQSAWWLNTIQQENQHCTQNFLDTTNNFISVMLLIEFDLWLQIIDFATTVDAITTKRRSPFYTPNTNRDYFYRLNYCRVSWQIAMHNLWNQWIIINDKYPYVRLAAITIFTKRKRERMKKNHQQKKTLSYFHWS